jgi:hypothetical protein
VGHDLSPGGRSGPVGTTPTVALWPYLTGAVATIALAVIVGLSLTVSGPLAVTSGLPDPTPPGGLEGPIALDRDAVDDAVAAAGCEVLAERAPLEDRSHVDLNQVPPLEELYPDIRPTHSGPHTATIHPVVADADSQLDELGTTHNLEHGSVIIWWDPDALGDADVEDIRSLATALNASGFGRPEVGVGILSSPFTDPGIGSAGAVALRAWGTAVDCERWDDTVALAFIAEHFGDRGVSPERSLAPYPDGVVGFTSTPT